MAAFAIKTLSYLRIISCRLMIPKHGKTCRFLISRTTCHILSEYFYEDAWVEKSGGCLLPMSGADWRGREGMCGKHE